MAEIRSFSFDEPEEAVAGGFNDISPAPEDMPDGVPAAGELEEEAQPDESKPADDVPAAEGIDDPGQPGEPPAAEPEAAAEGSSPEPPEAPPEPGPQTPPPDAQIKLMLAQQQAQIEYLTGLLSTAGAGVNPAPTGEGQGVGTPSLDQGRGGVNPHPGSQPQAPQLTEEEIIADPVGAISKAVDAKISQFRQEQAQQQQAQQNDAQIKTRQERAWSQLQEQMPVFQNEQVQQMWANVFYNPANGYVNDPAGPIKAGNQVANMLRGMGMGAPANPPDTGGTPLAAAPADIKTVEAKAAEAERARQTRVKQSAMHGGGKGGNRQKVTGLTKQHLQYAKEFGVDPKAVQAVIDGRDI